ncbi:MotE family protein [Nitratidesulfovibrio sp. 1201_IL3209]|uniref:MotE family protein n=1 Tax=Nitratidesulfovibrio sp. 1201_IL3209 TaxID=3084053 RepID=UPI002FD92DEB
MTKPQRFASSLRLSRLCRWLIAAAALKVALLAGFALEQPWPFATGAAPAVVATAPGAQVPSLGQAAGQTTSQAGGQSGGSLDLPLAADIARITGLASPAAARQAPADPAAPVATVAAVSAVAAAPAPSLFPATPAVNDVRNRMTRDGTAWAAEAQPAPAAVPPATPAIPASAGTGAAANQLSRDDLNRRQEDLNRREQELKSLEQQIDAKLAQMQDLEARIQTMLKDAQGMKDEKLRHLVDVYTNMKAKQAAAVLETLDEKIAVRILAGMRGRQAGEILTYVQAEKAAKLSEALTRMQLPLE